MAGTFTGTFGNDDVHESAAWDFMCGLDGDDVLYTGNVGLDVIEGGRGNDTVGMYVTSGSGFGHIYGGDSNDVVTGSINNDYLYGGEENDVLGGGYFYGTSSTPFAKSVLHRR